MEKEEVVLNQLVHTQTTKMLAKNEEVKLLEKAEKGDSVSLLKLAEEGLKLSVLVSKKYKGEAELEYLIRTGFRGWILAYMHFDKTKNYKLSTYSTWWITQEIEKYIKRAIK